MSSEVRPSLMAKRVFLPEMYPLLGLRTPSGATLADHVRSGVDNPDSSVGLYATEPESYGVFSALFEPVIAEYHGFDPAKDKHVTDFDVEKIPTEPIDPTGEAIVSTRVRVGRNLANFPFAPMITKRQRLEVMHRVAAQLYTLEGDLSGEFYQLDGMPEDVRAQLVADHFLFKQGDRFLASAGANRDWPTGRGIFHNDAKTALVWVNEEDQLRIISMEKGGDLRAVFGRLARMVAHLEKALPFAMHPVYGALSSCPTNLGTAMRASVHVKLPKLSRDKARFEELCKSTGLSIRGIHGEHSESEGGVYDISNKRRLGLSEVGAALQMYNGVKMLLEEERKLA